MSARVKQKNPDALRQVYERLGRASRREIAVGFPQGKVQAYPETGAEVAEVAARHVFGIGVPQRDFFGVAMPKIAVDVRPFLRAIAKAYSEGKPSGAIMVLEEAAGQKAQAALRTAITDGEYDALAPATIAARKAKGRPSDKPLIETSHMLGAVTHVVREK